MNTRRSQKVLLVSSADGIRSALEGLINKDDSYYLSIVDTASAAKTLMSKCFFDLIIVNSPLSDENGILFASECVSTLSAASSVCVITKDSVYETVKNQLEDIGVFAISKPTTLTVLKEALSWMSCTRERVRRMDARTNDIQKKLNDTAIINRAKCLLISDRFMSEHDAHKYIEKTAMDNCIPRVEVAQTIISEHS